MNKILKLGGQLLRRTSSFVANIQYLSQPKQREILNRNLNNPWKEIGRGCFTIEPINVCNAKCTFCAYQYQTRKMQVIADSVFKKALEDYVAIGGGDLGISCTVGDPLLDKKIVEKIQTARQYSEIKKIGITTNAIDLHRIGVENFLKSGLTDVTISTSGFNEERYKRVYRNNSYLQMKNNLLALLRKNQELATKVSIDIGLRIDESLELVSSEEGFKEVIELANAVDANKYFDSWGGKIKQSDLTGNMRLRPQYLNPFKTVIPCAMTWIGFAVLVDGSVTACSCRDVDGNSDLIVGNIQTDSLSDILNSSKVQKLRQEWGKQGWLPDICMDCSHYSSAANLLV
jgi:radical SAM protein with 4Fe4S-binding SPASM domain